MDVRKFIQKVILENVDFGLSNTELDNISRQVSAELAKTKKEVEEIGAQINSMKIALEKVQLDDGVRQIVVDRVKQLENSYPYKDFNEEKYRENLFNYYKKKFLNDKRYERERQELLKRNLSKEDIIDLFVTALEGGSNYWYYIPTLPNGVNSSEAIGNHILNGGYVVFHDAENHSEILGTVDMDSILEAISLVKSKYPDVWENILLENADANDADVFLQLCVMGEVVFG
jgi:hypothetical protein